MPTNVYGRQARDIVTQQTHYLRRRILGASGAGVYFLGTVPAGANLTHINNSVRTALDGVPTMTIGTLAAPANVAASGTHGLTAVGYTNVAIAAGAGSVPDVDTDLYATIGGAPTAGVADVQIFFTIPNDK